MNNPEYLGDGVYLQILPDKTIALRANHRSSEQCTDEIFLEPYVFEALKRYTKQFQDLSPEDQTKLINQPSS